MKFSCLLIALLSGVTAQRNPEKAADVDKMMADDPEFRSEVEEQMKRINKKFGLAEGDMHGVQDDLQEGWSEENVGKDFDSDEFTKQIQEEIRKINLEHGLDENEMHGLDLNDLDSMWAGAEDVEDVTPDYNPLEDLQGATESLKQLQNEHDAKLAKMMEDNPDLDLGQEEDDLDIDNLADYDDDMPEDGEFNPIDDDDDMPNQRDYDPLDYDEDDLDADDWNFENNYFEGIDGLEEFEEDLSEDDTLEEGEEIGDLSDWDWSDEEEESEAENERQEDGGWENNWRIEEHEAAIGIIVVVSIFMAAGGCVWYQFSGKNELVDESGKKLTRKQRGLGEDDVVEKKKIQIEENIDNI